MKKKKGRGKIKRRNTYEALQRRTLVDPEKNNQHKQSQTEIKFFNHGQINEDRDASRITFFFLNKEERKIKDFEN